MTRDCCLTSLCLSCSDRNGSCYPRASLTLWYALTTSPRSTFPVPGKPQTHSLCLHQIPHSRPSPNLSLNVSLVPSPSCPATPARPSCSSFQNLPSPSPLKNVSQNGSLQAPSLEPSWMPGPGATSRQCSLPSPGSRTYWCCCFPWLALGVSGMEQLGYKIMARSKEDRAGHSGAAGEMGTQHCVGWIHGL